MSIIREDGVALRSWHLAFSRFCAAGELVIRQMLNAAGLCGVQPRRKVVRQVSVGVVRRFHRCLYESLSSPVLVNEWIASEYAVPPAEGERCKRRWTEDMLPAYLDDQSRRRTTYDS